MNGLLSLTGINREQVAGLIQRNESGDAREYVSARLEIPRIGIMAFKTILTVAGPEAAWEGDLKLAADLYEQTEAHLSVLVMALAASPPIGDCCHRIG
jgi:hypothetical protein